MSVDPDEIVRVVLTDENGTTWCSYALTREEVESGTGLSLAEMLRAADQELDQ